MNQVFTDGDADGRWDNAPVTVDANGPLSGGTNGHTQPIDADGNATYDFQEFGVNLPRTAFLNNILLNLSSALDQLLDLIGY